MKILISTAFLMFTTYLQGQVNAYSLEEALNSPKETESLILSGVNNFPVEILELSNLRVLIIENSEISFPVDISKLAHLDRLEVSACQSFPYGINHIRTLKTLVIAGGLFDSIKLEEASQISVNKLVISNLYRTSKVPENWNEITCDSLEIAFFNDLNDFGEIRTCRNLRYLNIYRCNNRILPACLFQPEKLEYLTIQAMNIDSTVATEVISLKTIHLIDCAVECQIILEEWQSFQIVIEQAVGLREDCKSIMQTRKNIIFKSL
jgi:hypothetical protein